MTRNVEHTCGHVVEWSAETANEATFTFDVFLAWQAEHRCPFCGGVYEGSSPLPNHVRAVRYLSGPLPESIARFPETVARRLHEWGA
jgi:hypothetical protein